MSYAWLTTTEADAYFENRFGSASYWTSGVDKTALIHTAQRDLEMSGLFEFLEDTDSDGVLEDLAASGATPSTSMKEAVCEQALFRLQNPEIEQRLNLRAQGVASAGVVNETYHGGVDSFPIAPKARALLKQYAQAGNTFDWIR